MRPVLNINQLSILAVKGTVERKIIDLLLTSYPRSLSKKELMNSCALYEHAHGELLAHTRFYNAVIKATKALRHFGLMVHKSNSCSPAEAFEIRGDGR